LPVLVSHSGLRLAINCGNQKWTVKFSCNLDEYFL
jgi:hypothetical protein